MSALRLGALDMAIGNLLGSNLFNVAILAIDDLFYLRGGPLLAEARVRRPGLKGRVRPCAAAFGIFAS